MSCFILLKLALSAMPELGAAQAPLQKHPALPGAQVARGGTSMAAFEKVSRGLGSRPVEQVSLQTEYHTKKLFSISTDNRGNNSSQTLLRSVNDGFETLLRSMNVESFTNILTSTVA